MSPLLQAAVAEVPGLNAIISGNYEQGWEEFYNNYYPTVVTQVIRSGIVETLDGVAEAEEVAHDIIANMARNESAALKGLEQKNDLGIRGYFKAAVRNHHADLIRAKVNQREQIGQVQPLIDEEGWETFTEEELVAGYIGSHNPRPDELVEFKEIAHYVPEWLNALPPHHARILGMLAEGMNQPQVAEALGVNLNTVGIRVKRAWAAARKLLKTMTPQLSEELIPQT